MSNPKNGDYLIMTNGQVVQYLGKDHDEAIEWLNKYYRQNMSKRPDAYLVQVQAQLEYAPPNITTIAHEVMT